MNGISEGYVDAPKGVPLGAYDNAWKDPAIPNRQYHRVVVDEMVRYRAGEDILPYRVGLQCVKALPPMGNPTLLDVGASSAYYREVFARGGFACDYTALDYSEHFRPLIESVYPGTKFDVGDACALPYPDASFDIVFHSACLMHVRDYPRAIAEAARVARRYVIFHRTPVDWSGTTYFTKEAYGVRCLEIHFSPSELKNIFDRVGLDVINEIGLTPEYRSYICEKGLFWHPV